MKDNDMMRDPFEEYIKSREPGIREKGHAWQIAIGLQKVDGLDTSEYLKKTAYRHIEGQISISEAKSLIDDYYKQPGKEEKKEERTEEADKVSARIAEILSENSFTFGVTSYLSIHKRLFSGIYSHAGKIRDYNISKKEWVLNGDTVMYGGAVDLHETLEYDIRTESMFSYAGLSMTEVIRHIAQFISGVWQIHVFEEGNTRTTAVFLIMYLRKLGFEAENETFANNAWYFRNALVRANYTNIAQGIHASTEYLELFLRNLLLGEKNELKNRYLNVMWNERKQDIQDMKQDIENKKQDIDTEKQDIETVFPYGSILEVNEIKGKTRHNIERLFAAFQFEEIFGRSEVMTELGLTASPSSALIKRMEQAGIIKSVKGIGKGKYRFNPDSMNE